MPVQPTYPGVYINELPSAVRTITGVPTSVAAFVGAALRGPDNKPVHITSFADYTATFGALHATVPLSHAVYQFYLNGGSEAEIVRLVGTGAARSTATFDTLTLNAAGAGAWGDRIRFRVDHDTATGAATLYNLTVRDNGTGAEERYLNVSTNAADPRALHKVLRASALVQLPTGTEGPTTRPQEHPDPPEGVDPLADPTPAPPPATPEQEAPPVYSTPLGGGQPGGALTAASYTGDQNTKTGLWALDRADIFNMLYLPGISEDGSLGGAVYPVAADYCQKRRAMFIVETTKSVKTVSDAVTAATGNPFGIGSEQRKNVAGYFPWVNLADPAEEGGVREFPPGGVVAGIWARTDAQRGVWKAPAGTEASLNGVQELTANLTDTEHGRLNPLGLNCLRQFPVTGNVVWGARTLAGADRLADQWKYLPVRRLALFLEESLFRGTQWVVFEPNDEPLWSSVRLNVGAFMNTLFRQGAFQGQTPQQAYLVKCDRENNPQNDIDRGILNILVGFAPLKPAEFVLINIQQLAGQVQV
ncbi:MULTISPECIES: phage tail sheath subtilisin-like domain-containing protein [unclassified Crossiella]|uniref:phage tail sheath subtilisin-like domain-containing protein n=1 Tax=unclassified Crossiella TaxID=2620835 RepID=UPI001FFEC73E|nr:MULTISPECIES: phage tail sheath subtilisin-like domain-containing protein [unclassified Crossiella]MCK2242796.1 phage tail sheath subtilisin-like domain-containing protein [Crossiella sp. S99.2]MCK2256673.1 phage tail sheath subtilisin-like domain-containing protein [Crossiella sp. S99.1]